MVSETRSSGPLCCSTPAPQNNLQQEGGPGHEMTLGVAQIQGEGRGHKVPGRELRLLNLPTCETEGRGVEGRAPASPPDKSLTPTRLDTRRGPKRHP